MDDLYRIEGSSWSKVDLLRESMKQSIISTTSDFQRDTWTFIQNWLDDTGAITVRTSGSTGKPKTYKVLKQWMKSSAKVTSKALGLRPNMKALLCISPKYIGGMMMIVRSLELGMDLYLQEPSNLPIAPRQMDFTAMVPMQINQLLDGGIDLASYGILIIGGAPLDPRTEERIAEFSTPIYATYGMTETLSHVALRRLTGGTVSPYFEAVPGVSFSLSPDDLLSISIDHMDSLVVNSNDRAALLDVHHFRWLGRADNIINSGGIKIVPEEIENQLAAWLDIPFFIYKEAHQEYGETVVLCVEGSEVDIEEIQEAIDRVSPRTHKPTRVYSIESFSRTGNGKAQRSVSFSHKKKRLI